MLKRLDVVILHIRWFESRERIRIDLAEVAAKRKVKLPTFEIWNGDDDYVRFNVLLSYGADESGRHCFVLKYLASNNTHLVSNDFVWGSARIIISASLENAEAEWRSEPTEKGCDGFAKSVKLHVQTASTKKESVVAVRKAQALFKKSLMRIGPECCVITGEVMPEVLDAAHIQSVEAGGPDEIENGILLRADLHRLYDAGCFEIKPNGSLSLRKGLPRTYRELLKGKVLTADVLQRIKPFLVKRQSLSSRSLHN